MEFNDFIPYAPANRKKVFYYYTPTQVKFLDFDSEELCWIGGIAFHDVVICGCCGGVIKISELYERAKEMNFNEEPIKAFNSWVNIENEIKGE